MNFRYQSFQIFFKNKNYFLELLKNNTLKKISNVVHYKKYLLARIIQDKIDFESAIINYNITANNEDIFLLLLVMNGENKYLEKYFNQNLKIQFSHAAAFSNNLL